MTCANHKSFFFFLTSCDKENNVVVPCIQQACQHQKFFCFFFLILSPLMGGGASQFRRGVRQFGYGGGGSRQQQQQLVDIGHHFGTYVYVLEGERVEPSGIGTFKKSHISIVSSWLLLTIWNSSNCNRNTRPECSCKTRAEKKGVKLKCRQIWLRREHEIARYWFYN